MRVAADCSPPGQCPPTASPPSWWQVLDASNTPCWPSPPHLSEAAGLASNADPRVFSVRRARPSTPGPGAWAPGQRHRDRRRRHWLNQPLLASAPPRGSRQAPAASSSSKAAGGCFSYGPVCQPSLWPPPPPPPPAGRRLSRTCRPALSLCALRVARSLWVLSTAASRRAGYVGGTSRSLHLGLRL